MVQEQKTAKVSKKKKAYTRGNISEQCLYNCTDINTIINFPPLEIIYSQSTENITMLIECLEHVSVKIKL